LQQAGELGTDYFTTEGVAAGDFDGDGDTDVAIATGDPRAAVLVFHGLGNGQFTGPAALAPLSTQPGISDGTSAISAGDLNGDGPLDAVASNIGQSVSLLYGAGDGSSQAPADAAMGPEPVSLAAADFDGDGRADVAVADLSDNAIRVRLSPR